MKKVFMVLGIIVLTFMLIIGLLFFAVGVSESETAMLVFGFCVFVASLASIICIGVKNSKTTKFKENQQKSKEKWSREHFFRNVKYRFTHVLGLPIMEGAVCNVTSEYDKIVIESQGVVLSLSKDRITYIGDDETVKYLIFDYAPRATTLIRDFELFNKSNFQKKIIEIK